MLSYDQNVTVSAWFFRLMDRPVPTTIVPSTPTGRPLLLTASVAVEAPLRHAISRPMTATGCCVRRRLRQTTQFVYLQPVWVLITGAPFSRHTGVTWIYTWKRLLSSYIRLKRSTIKQEATIPTTSRLKYFSEKKTGCLYADKTGFYCESIYDWESSHSSTTTGAVIRPFVALETALSNLECHRP